MNNFPHVHINRDPRNRKLWNVYVDDSLYSFGHPDRAAAESMAKTITAELHCALSVERLTTQQILKQILN